MLTSNTSKTPPEQNMPLHPFLPKGRGLGHWEVLEGAVCGGWGIATQLAAVKGKGFGKEEGGSGGLTDCCTPHCCVEGCGRPLLKWHWASRLVTTQRVVGL